MEWSSNSIGQAEPHRASIVIFIFDRINRIDWIYSFLGFRMKPRNNNLAFSEKRKYN